MQYSEILKRGPVPYVARNLAVLWVPNEFATMPAFERDQGRQFYQLCPRVYWWIEAAFEARKTEANRLRDRSRQLRQKLWCKRQNEHERRISPFKWWVCDVFTVEEIERGRELAGSLPDVLPGTTVPPILATVGKTAGRLVGGGMTPFAHKPLEYDLPGIAA